MPQIQAARKALRVDARRRAVNDRWRRKLREAMNAVRFAVTGNDAKTAKEAAAKAISVIDRVARRNIMHPNKAARKKSQLEKTIAKLAQTK